MAQALTLPHPHGDREISFYDVREEPFSVHGLYKPQETPYFCRCPEAVAKATNEWVSELYRDTAGGRIRFATDSPFVALHVEWPGIGLVDHMCLNGQSGFDLYEDGAAGSRYVGTFRIEGGSLEKVAKGYDSAVNALPGGGLRFYTIHMPLYNHVDRVCIGLSPDALLLPAQPYAFDKPVLYYGSSITQGGCASRPGMAYENIISRELNADHINLGFSGAGRGEDSIVSYMLTLDISVFVSDYDHNAPNADHLDRTLRRMFGRFREKKPELPIILVSMPNICPDHPDEVERRAVIHAVYDEAVRAGDRKVWFVDGESLFPSECRFDCTVDGCHPNDLGFRGMANRIGAAVRLALNSK